MYYVKDSNSLRAVVFPAKNGNTDFDTSRMQILKWRKDSIDIEEQYLFLGDQQTKGEGVNNEFKKLIREIEANNQNPDSAKITFVVFDPIIDSADGRRFNYKMYGVTDADVREAQIKSITVTKATSDFYTNPSPPAKPY